MRRVFLCVVPVWFLFNSAGAVFGASVQKHVLLLYEDRSDLLGNVVFDRAIRSALQKRFNVDVDVHSEYPDVSPILEHHYPALQSWLRSKYARKDFDVVVPVGAGALRFVRAYHQDLFRSAQIVFFGRREAIDNWRPGPPLTGVVATGFAEHVKRNFAFILRLQPDVKQVMVVTGSAWEDRHYEATARRELLPYEDRIAVTYLAGLSLEKVLERLASLPERTAIFFLSMSEDGAGRHLLKSEVLSKVTLAAAAPVYSTSALHFDTGIIGGDLMSQETMANDVGGLVVRLLQGEPIESMPIREGPLVPMVNWRQLRRWGIPEDRLPPGTVTMYRDPSIWDLYRWHMIGAISLFTIESMLIVALLVHRAWRRKAEKSMRESQRLLQSTIDALNAQVALLDETGKIIAVNQSWRSFAETNGYIGADKGVGRNYLEICESAGECEEARLVGDAIRLLVSGEREEFCCIYQFVGGTEESWFQVRMNRFYTDGALRLVIAYEDVTEIKQAHDAQQQITGMLLRAQDDERRRIARDLHDVTVQNVATIKADLIRVRKGPELQDGKVAETLAESLMTCDQVIKELRTLSYLLHPPLLDEIGLMPALQWYIRGFTERSGVRAELSVMEDIGRLATDVETALFRVVQESLTNIHRHSGSPSAMIRVMKENGTVAVQIMDEGHGMSLTALSGIQEGAPLPGVGIMGMRQRLKQLGGRLEIDSNSQGTIVTARISISEESHAAHLVSR
jgi:two-component system NarL family sensor kinase